MKVLDKHESFLIAKRFAHSTDNFSSIRFLKLGRILHPTRVT